jgi:hypothetical protein
MHFVAAPTRPVAFCLGALLALTVLLSAAQAEDLPLHERIDRILEANAVGPIAPVCNDADFIRRVWLDLAGVVPPASEAKAFLENPSPDKRAQLIDQLLASPHFLRHYTLVLDVGLMERRPDKAVKTPEWQEYLYDFLAAGRPLDELYRELLTADGVQTGPRAAARFLLDRDCEPNALTRDIGRIFFGRDLQCAQCHDHPIIDDYYQAEYYGLSALVVRTSAFNNAKAKRMEVAEKADGEASFQSVFTKTGSDRQLPRVPLGTTVLEPPLEKGTEYVVAPAKDVRPVPKYSRRAQLAAVLAESDQFRRNVANRIWALVMGRGLVHPVDGHHANNPATCPEALALLTQELVARKFDLKSLVRELVLTRTYQRSCDPPKPEQFDFATLETLEKSLAAERETLAAVATKADFVREELDAKLMAATEERTKRQAELKPLDAAVTKAHEAHDKVTKARDAAKAALAKQQEQTTAVTEAAAKAKAAVEKVPGDKLLAEAAAKIAERQTALEAAAKAASDKVTAATKPVETALAELNMAREALAKARAPLRADEAWLALEREERAALRNRLAADEAVAALDKRLALVKSLQEFKQQQAANPDLAAKSWDRLVEEWTVRGQVGPLKALSAEQLALSLMQATGALDPQRPAALAAVQKKPPELLTKASETDKPRVLERLTEHKLLEQLRGPINVFVGLYADAAGEEFQATANQALFFGNNNQVASWLNPGGGNLVERLTKAEDPAALSEELYLSLFARRPADDEKAAIAQFLAERAQDKPAAVQEIIWALLASNEFRFNH